MHGSAESKVYIGLYGIRTHFYTCKIITQRLYLRMQAKTKGNVLCIACYVPHPEPWFQYRSLIECYVLPMYTGLETKPVYRIPFPLGKIIGKACIAIRFYFVF